MNSALYKDAICAVGCVTATESLLTEIVRGGLSFLGTVIQLLSYLILGVRITGSFSLSLFSFSMWIL